MAWSLPYQEILETFRGKHACANGREAKKKVVREVGKAIKHVVAEKHQNPPPDLEKVRFPAMRF